MAYRLRVTLLVNLKVMLIIVNVLRTYYSIYVVARWGPDGPLAVLIMHVLSCINVRFGSMPLKRKPRDFRKPNIFSLSLLIMGSGGGHWGRRSGCCVWFQAALVVVSPVWAVVLCGR